MADKVVQDVSDLPEEIRHVFHDMRLEFRDPRTLKPHPENWKQHGSLQREAYRELKKEVGWAGILLYNERTDRLIDGHMREQDALEDNEPYVPVLVIDVDEETERTILRYRDEVGGLWRPVRKKVEQLDADLETRSELLASIGQGDRPDPYADEEGQFKDPVEDDELPPGGISMVLGESYDYIVLVFDRTYDFTAAKDLLGVEDTRCAFSSGVGTGRVIDGGRLLELLMGGDEEEEAEDE